MPRARNVAMESCARKSSASLLALEHRVHVRERESAREEMSTLPRAELDLDVVAEVVVAGVAKDEHPLSGRRPLEQLIHPGQRREPVALVPAGHLHGYLRAALSPRLVRE